jgi:hypothetical protein
MARKTIEEYIKNYKEINGCHIYQGYFGSQGYGRFMIKGKHYNAHQESYKFHKGEIPEGLWICHKCNIPSCINPEHLYAGLPIDNVEDRMRKYKGSDTREIKNGLIRIGMFIPKKLKTDLKLMSILTERPMSDIIRISIQEKIKKLKDEQINKSV